MLRSMKTVLLGVALAAISAACSLGAGPEATPTLSSDDVLRTAEAIAQQTRQAVSATPSPTPPTPTLTEPLETPTPEATATPEKPTVTADYNANVRNGPGEEYEVIDFFLEGQQGEVAGRYENPSSGTWWFIRRIGGGLDGWVWGGAVTFAGDESRVPVLEPPPTTTPTPKPTNPPPPPSETPTIVPTPA